MATATRTATINAPIDDVWPVLADFAGVSRWNPVVTTSRPVGNKTTGLSARRRCEFNHSGSKWLEEEIIAFDETNHRYAVQFKEGTEKPPIENVLVDISARPLSPTSSEVTMTVALTGRGLLQKLIAGIGSIALRRTLRQLIAGLELHVLTGDEITDPSQLRAKSPHRDETLAHTRGEIR